MVVAGGTTAAGLATAAGLGPASAMPPILVIAIALCMVAEWRHPIDRRWSMTRRTLLRRDLPYIGFDLALARVSEVVVVAIAAAVVPSAGFGPIGRLPLVFQVVVAIAGFDLLWYWYHRTAHRTATLWRVHGAHHTPSQLYVLMHGVFHPFDQLVVRLVLGLVVFQFGGFTPDATFIALTVIGLIGIVSHANVDVRIWAFNHLLISPETHRIHHSAADDGNYGTATSLWDQVFGTFIYRSRPPERLGLGDPADYPDPERFLTVLAWPVIGRNRRAVPVDDRR